MKEINPFYYLAGYILAILLLIGMAIGCYYHGKKKGYVEMEDEIFNDIEMKGKVND
jgi:hypothetical protein